MADRQVRSHNGVELPEVEGWQWLEDADGVLILTDAHVTTGVGPAEIYVANGMLFASAGYGPIVIDTVLMKALLEASCG